jgi:hypothetical protein
LPSSSNSRNPDRVATPYRVEHPNVRFTTSIELPSLPANLKVDAGLTDVMNVNTIVPYEETRLKLRWVRNFAQDVKRKLGLAAGIACKSATK